MALTFLLAAIFGSCPTVYSGEDGSQLEAETFSYSIVPLFEGRDLDRLAARPGPDGRLRLEIRNEALETHYINHLQLVEVTHGPGETALPDQSGQAVAVGPLQTPVRALSRSGRDLGPALAETDGRAARTDERTLAAAGVADFDDWIDLTFPGPRRSERAAVVLRARNSLLNTVLFYDVMLAGAGAQAVDWLAGDLERISTAVEMGRWARQRMGLRVAVWRAGRYEEVARVPDAGPIAWHDVAAVVPWPSDEPELRVRLSFVADAWRFDRVALAGEVRAAAPRVVPIRAVTGREGAHEDDALASLREPDDRYLQTSPGQRFQVHFDTGGSTAGRERTFLLSSQGYYTEWIRGSWLRAARPPRPLTPSDAALVEALRQWKAKRAVFEEQFERQRVAVR